jgi:hypothetical protein
MKSTPPCSPPSLSGRFATPGVGESDSANRPIEAILEATAGTLADDATAFCLDWHGGPVRERTTDAGADR